MLTTQSDLHQSHFHQFTLNVNAHTYINIELGGNLGLSQGAHSHVMGEKWN